MYLRKLNLPASWTPELGRGSLAISAIYESPEGVGVGEGEMVEVSVGVADGGTAE